MRLWILGPLFLCFFSLQIFAAETEGTESQILLTYEQFSHLTNAEQKTYIKKLREIMNEVSAAFPEFAQEMSAHTSFFAQVWNLNFQTAFGEGSKDIPIETIENYIKYANGEAARYSQSIAKVKIENLSAEEKKLWVEKYRQAFYWAASAASQAHAISDQKIRQKLLTELIAPTKKAIEKQETLVKKIANETEYSEARDHYFRKSLDGELRTDDEFPLGALTPYGNRLIPRSNPPLISKVTAKATTQFDPKDMSDLPSIPKDETKKNVHSEITTGTAKSNTSNNSYYRCMYAGFVIKKGPECVAPSSLPWELSGLDSKTFVCENSTIMCNPLLFGFKTSCDWNKTLEKNIIDTCLHSATPYCVKKGLFATKNCGAISTSDSALQAAVQLINKNAAAFNQFGVSFDELCNKGLIDFNSYKGKRTPLSTQRTKDDIKRTCESARVRMAEIKKRFIIPESKSKKDSPLPAVEEASGNKTAQ